MSVWVEIPIVIDVSSPTVVTLHVSVWVEMLHFRYHNTGKKSRSTWACELKLGLALQTMQASRHAPRERVSWNKQLYNGNPSVMVTLHVSVWVEMELCHLWHKNRRSRSTWACESIFVSTQDLSILNNTNNRLTKVGRYFYTQILYIFYVFSVKSANSHPEICANKWFII